MWLPLAGVVVGLCLYDLTGGDGDLWPHPSRPGDDAAYRNPMDL